MIVERLVFKAKFGQGDSVVAAFAEMKEKFASRFDIDVRILTDYAGPMFTVVIEQTYRDSAHLAEAEAQEREMYDDAEFQQWFGSWQGLVDSGTRELYRVAG